MNALHGDVRVSLRLIAKHKGFALVSIVLLALGLGLNLGLFHLANSALFRVWPGLEEPEGLANLGRMTNGRGFDNTSWPVYSDLRKGSQLFSQIAAYDMRHFSLSFEGRTERLAGGEVSENYFAVLGVEPAAGRLFRAEEGQKPGADTVAVLSHSYWQSVLGGDPGIVGKAVRVNGQPFTIIGIAAKGFRGHEVRQGDIWVLLPTTTLFAGSDEFLKSYGWAQLMMVGRLKAGISHEAAQQEMNSLFAVVQKAHPVELERQGIRVTPYHPLGQADIRDKAIEVFGLFGALSALVLFSVGANLGGVMLSRALDRRREFAIRLSLGAGRWQLLRQMVVEACLLTLPGALLGLGLAAWATDLFFAAMPMDGFFLKIEFVPDGRMVAAFVGLCLFAIVSFVGVPAWQTLRFAVQPVLKGGEGGVGGQGTWAREGLVFVQIFVSVVLVCGSVLTGWSLWNLSRAKLNMKTDHLLSMEIHPGLNGYKDGAARELYRKAVEEVRALPGVVTASSTAMLPLGGGAIGIGALYGGNVPREKALQPDVSIVGPRYLETMGIPLQRGRDLRDEDRGNSGKVVVLNETLARKLFGDGEAVGRQIYTLFEEKPTAMEVVGVAADSVYRSPGEAARDMFFLPVQQFHFGSQNLVIRTAGEPLRMVEVVKQTMGRLDPHLPVVNVRTMEMQVKEATFPWRVTSAVSGMASVIGALIAVVGLFGLVAFSVARRTREIGLKMALGAAAGRIVRETVWKGARAAVGAALLGLVAAYAVAGKMGDFLYGIDPHDVRVYGGVALGFALVLAAAIAEPARRAMRVSPMEALRYE